MSDVIRGNLQLVHEDSRRAIYEFDSPQEHFSIVRLIVPSTATDNVVVGNHYHREKIETFLVLKGSGVVMTRQIDEQTGLAIGLPILRRIREGFAIKMKMFVAHAFVLAPGSEMTFFTSEAFNADDLIAHVLISPNDVAQVLQ